jgi:hypothetical protein
MNIPAKEGWYLLSGENDENKREFGTLSDDSAYLAELFVGDYRYYTWIR